YKEIILKVKIQSYPEFKILGYSITIFYEYFAKCSLPIPMLVHGKSVLKT
ncbi:hypothetical protein L9F63_009641, partial [Diploptera punctata]